MEAQQLGASFPKADTQFPLLRKNRGKFVPGTK
ncbi:hypothetical protein X755_06580 [Mesorhizobium sp. LNJC405B00]|nr:hypothetical protein X755_06580 [Mesorhizobium sp. LNJC405B00]